MRPPAEGFALLAVLGLLAVVGLYTAATLQDALFGTVLASTRVFQQHAFLLADLGIQSALDELADATPPSDYTRELHPLPGSDDSVTVVLRSGTDDALPAGFSAGRFIARRFEIESTGHSTRNARAVQVQGVVRLLPVARNTGDAMKLLPLVFFLLPQVAGSAATEPVDCLPAAPLPLNVRIGTALVPQRALLIGGSAPALRVVDADTGMTLWSAAAAAPVSQRFPAMTAAFSGSLIALDTDHDGLHDRLYAGDLAGRLWRFDLHNGAEASAWVSGGVFADFSNDAGRGFRAPPDVSLAAPAGVAPWFDIALGTAAPGHVAANNRLYLLRDHAPFDAWTDAQYRDWQPLREADLLQVTTAGESPSEKTQAGWFIELGSGEVITAALTIAGRVVFAVAESTAGTATGCRSAFSVATLDLAHGPPVLDASGNWRRILSGGIPTGAAFTLETNAGANGTSALCTLGDARVAECDVDMRPRRTWWRRGDAE